MIMAGDEPLQDDLPELSKRSTAAGRLKIYIGGAAGVGKTYRMLQEANQLKSEGHDVVIGVIETHNRPETEAQIKDLEAVPLREVAYRGVVLRDLDVDAVLARKPEIVIIDELAHTNAPGGRHVKRYQDVQDILAAGIDVISAFNIQHVESLGPLVKRITGVEVRETVPDSFLASADQVVTVDIAIDELRQRLREGKIYPTPQVEHALRNFFQPANLAALRELALREVARDQSRQREKLESLRREGGRRTAVAERLMACLSTNPYGGSALLRKAAREAARRDAEWYAVHIETPSESVQRISTADFRQLLDNINLAADLGAEVVWLKAVDVAGAILDFAREHHVTRILIGRRQPRHLSRFWQRSVTSRLLDKATEFDIEILASEQN
jgi:two-component system sensor histidine kinase KdpD